MVRILDEDERREGLGGTDIAGIAGVSQYSSPISVYLEKRGEAPPKPQTRRMRLGQIFEDGIADTYAEDHGCQLARMGVVFHKRYPFLYVHPDRRVVGEPGLVECKKWVGRVEQPTPAWQVQAQWQLALTGRLWVDVAVFDGSDVSSHRIGRDPELIESLEEMAVSFWVDHVLAGVPPPPDGTKAYQDYLASLYDPVEEERTATAEQVLMLDALRAYNGEARDTEAKIRLIKNRLAEQMGSATRLVAPGVSVTYRMREASDYTVRREAKRILSVRFTKEES